VTPLAIPEVLLVEPAVFGDARGFFMESFSARRYADAGIPGPFVQDNVSRSRRGVLRGLHLQHPHAQGKLVSVLEGEVFDVAVDVRVGSPTFGRWVGEYLSAENHRQLWVPAGFAHGFVVTSDDALFSYKCTEYYRPEAERAVRWDDPRIGITWPVEVPVVSPKDQAGLALDGLPTADLPRFVGRAA
jgi:dTDP-4-dehydrorhamnose 3,5-epimerase